MHKNTQDDLIKAAAGMMSDARFAIVIVDSATALFRTEFVGRGELASRQNQLGMPLLARAPAGLF